MGWGEGVATKNNFYAPVVLDSAKVSASLES